MIRYTSIHFVYHIYLVPLLKKNRNYGRISSWKKKEKH